MNKKELNVMYACDEKYAPFAGVSILSLLINNIDIERIRIFAVLNDVSDINKEKLKKTVDEYHRELIIIDAKEINDLMEELGVPKYRGSYSTHYRKFFTYFLPEDVETLLYIDSDSIVPGKLNKLLELDFNEKCAAVVLDTLGGKYKQLLGFKPDEPYFNAGVTYIDVKKWKERDYAQKLIDHIQNNRAKYCNPDQDLFNILLKGDTIVVGPEYNFQPAHRAYKDQDYFSNYPKEYYSCSEIEHARNNPVIIHAYRFLGEFPWHKNNCHPDNSIFDKYLSQSLWYDYEKKPAQVGLLFIIEKVLYKLLPRRIFLFIFSKVLYRTFYNKNRKLEKECNNNSR